MGGAAHSPKEGTAQAGALESPNRDVGTVPRSHEDAYHGLYINSHPCSVREGFRFNVRLILFLSAEILSVIWLG